MLCGIAMPSISAADAPAQTDRPPLEHTIRDLDARVFEAFNQCSDPAQLDVHAGYFSEDVEFYHDQGGVTWTREQMLANTRNHVCGKFTRQLVADSLVVHPIKDYGAIAIGTHRFCQTATGSCDGLADFTMIWHQLGDAWRITRVLSYGHRPAPAAQENHHPSAPTVNAADGAMP